MDGYGPSGVSFRRFPPERRSVPLARQFMRSVLRDVAPQAVETAELLTSELVTNAVLHAHTEVEVRVWSHEGHVRVRVGDGRPDRPLVPRKARPYAGTGRGLAVVQELASSHGAHIGEGRKTVWFELWPKAPVPPSSGWEPAPVGGRTTTVTLIDMPCIVFRAAQQHGDEMLRELMLTRRVEDRVGVSDVELLVAGDMANVLNASMTSALEETVTSGATVTVDIAFPSDAASAVDTLRRVFEQGDAAAQLGSVLTLPAPPHVRSHHQWVLDQLVAQLSGGPPTAWTLQPGGPDATSVELVPWDAGEVEDNSVPSVAADDDGRIITANTALADLLGWQSDELIGRPLTMLIPDHLRERHRAGFTALRLTGRSRIMGRSIPLPALHRDGSLVHVRLHVRSHEAVDGRTVRVGQFMPAATAPGEHRPLPPPTPAPSARPPSGTAAAPHAVGERTSRAWERLNLLADTTSALSSTLDLCEGLRRACQVLTRQMADWCVVDLLDEHGDAERVCVVHRDPRALSDGVYLGKLPAVSENAQGPLARVLNGAGPLLITDIPSPDQAENALDARQLKLFEQLDASSTIMAPLRGRREVLGALIAVRTGHDAPFTEDDALLIADLVEGISLSVDNARLHQHTRTAAERLQRSLLPRLPHIPFMEITARYAPSSTTAQIGGDWFDAFTLPDGDTALVIGDVSGHDLNAAVTMSQLRNMLRGIAVDCQDDPSEVLRRLDLATLTLYPHSTATCAYAVVTGPHSGPWEVRHSCAGHLPVLLTCPNGDTRYLDSASGLLIGVDSTLPRPTARDPLPAHSTLLMYTDGLIERPGESLSDSMGRLRRHAAALAQAPLDVFCDELILGLGAGSTDDIAVLALRPTPPPA
ncbi:SpoIIE family protein phosphatase [Streptomyces sp. NPDC046939]|uniref:SpoIIE family protein phosphatase n=1 Tax=Streptomyces sp. NPDC046939 TaxID=3155376 RepID=UPI0033FC1736